MSDSTLYLYTSLTAGSSHIVTATARIETILKANKLPFRAIDVATDDAARKLWGRRSKGKKLPGLVKYGDIVGDLEEIEEWNEFGELRMVVKNVPDLDGMPATSYPAPAGNANENSQATSTPKEPEPKTPKPSTIKIQSPPAKQEEQKDSTAVLALRQASAEAASKAKDLKSDKKEEKGSTTTTENEQPTSNSPTSKPRKASVAPELPDTAPDSPKGVKRPALVPEEAAVSSANFHADNAEMLGLVEHHRGSIISNMDKEEQDKAVKEIRSSISAEVPPGSIDALRKEAAAKPKQDSVTIEESPIAEAAVEEEESMTKKAETGPAAETKDVATTESTDEESTDEEEGEEEDEEEELKKKKKEIDADKDAKGKVEAEAKTKTTTSAPADPASASASASASAETKETTSATQ
ncbi:hypothetical protein N7478_008805 [Penicillium angulare]|uniref:uncharacterized protein n=1 Tax=Penicillium angulare TaxID=116970 RepID=UPI002541924B|nr:uncharacterized protein N7478_008805 [Penicillium angulare]KAJ5273680.1 hypothetical protein N7478_008805 [Penicillium angulare]